MIYDVKVPNQISPLARILAIGESPGEDEEQNGKPFVGVAGQLLRSTIERHGLDTEKDVSYCNLSQFRPQHNKFFHLYGSRELREGQAEVTKLIESRQYNVIVPLGNEALDFVTGKKRIGIWRGSIITSENIPTNRSNKVIPTFHPSYINRDPNNLPTFDMDWARIAGDSKFPELNYTKRDYHINPTGMELEKWTHILCNSPIFGADIETTKDIREIICIGFAPSPNLGITIFLDSEHSRSCVRRILLSPAKKVFHFGIFDRLVLAEHEYECVGPFGDTFLAQHTLNAGLPNGLDYLTSLYTREPYYKQEGRAEIPKDTKVWASTSDKSKLGIYNCKDGVCTIEIYLTQLEELTQEGLIAIYDNAIEQLEMAIDISQVGIEVDMERRALLARALIKKWTKMQWAINMLCREEEVNVNSPKLKKILYTKLKLPERKKRDKNGNWVVTTDDAALVSLLAFTKGKIEEYKTQSKKDEWEKLFYIVQLIHKIRGVRKLLSSYIAVKVSANGRLRSMYKVGGAETGRWSCNKFVDGTGLNAQTFYRGTIEIPDDIDEEVVNMDKILDLVAKEENDDEPIQEEAVA